MLLEHGCPTPPLGAVPLDRAAHNLGVRCEPSWRSGRTANGIGSTSSVPQGSATVIVNLYEELIAIVRELEAAKLNYAVCGGMAVAIHGLARFTKDIDLLIQREDLKAVRDVVERCGFTLEGGILPMGAGEPIERDIFRISKVIDKELVTLDLLLVNLPLQQAFESREYYEFRGQRLQAVSPAGLYLMKKIAGRPQDIVDLQRLGLWPHDSNP